MSIKFGKLAIGMHLHGSIVLKIWQIFAEVANSPNLKPGHSLISVDPVIASTGPRLCPVSPVDAASPSGG